MVIISAGFICRRAVLGGNCKFCQFSFALEDSYIKNADIPQECEG